MRSLAVVVPRAEGEAVRRRLAALGLLRADLRIAVAGEAVALPVRALPAEPLPDVLVEEREFAPLPAPAARRYAELADLPPEVRARLPRAFDVVGDIALVRLEPEVADRAEAIGAALLRFLPGVRLVAADEGVKGPARIRTLRRIAGSGPFRTVHAENGLSFVVDLERAYFSPRLGREHARVAAAGRAGESVLDLCCGVGPFGLTLLARAGAGRAELVDANPAAIALVEENARRLRVAERARAVPSPLDAHLAGGGRFDRVVFNLPREGIKYVSQVGGAVAVGGTLHYYEIMERSRAAERVADALAELPGDGWRLAERHVVHPYSPAEDLVGMTFRRAAG